MGKDGWERERYLRFTYHAPSQSQIARLGSLRHKARQFADLVIAETPESREQSLALTKLEETVMWANAAIVRRENNGE